MTIIRKRGRYGVKVYDRGRQRWVGTFDTLKAAKQAERGALDNRLTTTETCASLSARWPDEAAELRGWRRSTTVQYVQMLKPLVEDLGDTPIAEVDRPVAKRFARSHPSSVRYVQAMFSDAVKDGLLPSNPFLGLRPARGRGRRDIDAPPSRSCVTSPTRPWRSTSTTAPRSAR